MTIQQRKLILDSSKIFDLLGMIFCFLLAAWVSSASRDVITFENFLSLRIKIVNLLLFTGLLISWHLIFSRFSLYKSRRLSNLEGEFLDILKAVSVGTLVILSVTFLADIRMIHGTFLVAFWASATLITLFSRLVIRFALKQIRKQGRNLRNLVIVGTNARALQFADKIESRTELGYRLLGFVDSTWKKINEFQKSGRTLIASLTEFPDFLRTQAVDEVMVCLPFKSCYQQASQIVALCEEQGILVRFLSDLFDSKGSRLNTETFEGTPVTTIAGGNLRGWGSLFKRSFDFTISLILLILLSPLFLITALWIKAGSPGPAFFRQERLGLNKRRILVYKFRTMVRDADKKQAELEALNEAEGPVFKIKNDPRITPWGNF